MSVCWIELTTAMYCLAQGEGDIQAFLAAALVDGTNNSHFAIRGRTVANAENNQIPLIALDVFEILNQQASELSVNFAFVFRFQALGESLV